MLVSSVLLAPVSFAQSPFLTTATKVEIGIYASAIAADGWATQHGVGRGDFTEYNPLAEPFIRRGAIGQSIGNGLGFAVGVLPSYLLFKKRHTKLARAWLHVATAGELVTAGLMVYSQTHYH